MNKENNCIYEFGDFSLDPENNSLYHADKSINLTTKDCQVLIVLIENHGQTVSKDELLETIWKESNVEEGILSVHISNLRKVLNDDRKNPKFIETLPKRGYRFITEVKRKEKVRFVDNGDASKLNRAATEPSIPNTESSTANKEAKNNNSEPHNDPTINPAVNINKPRFERLKTAHPIAFVLIMVTFIVCLGFISYSWSKKTDKSEMKLSSIVGTEKSRKVAISPDAKYIAHVVVDANNQSLWL